MTNLKNIGRIFYGMGIIGIGCMHFFYQGIRPIIMPIPHEATQGYAILIYLMAFYITVSGILITVGKYVKPVALLLAVFFFACLLIVHIPVWLSTQGPTINVIKIFALSGGALIVALAYPSETPNIFFERLGKVMPGGIYFYAIMLILFGISHLLAIKQIGQVVPIYLPWREFWGISSGIGLICAGVAFLIRFKMKMVGMILSITLFLWLFMFHLYYTIRFPKFSDGENFVGSYQCLAFCGIALLITAVYPQLRDRKQKEVVS
jgi:uncharacterized membrane protein YphA (DoxX/SURF4 family)